MDPNITPIISELNKKGYITEFSCEGHEEFEHDVTTGNDIINTSIGYIRFAEEISKDILNDYPLPKPWAYESTKVFKTKTNANGESIYLNETYEPFLIRCDYESHQKPIQERMRPLRKWVESLPNYNTWLENHKEAN